MEKIVKIKIPVNYVKTKDGEDTLIYSTIETLESNVAKYGADCKRIEEIFADINNSYEIIGTRIRKIIELSSSEADLLRFLMDNEWILRFAYKSDLDNLLANPKFILIKENVKIPYDAYISQDNGILFTTVKQVPVWKKRKLNYQFSIIEWLVMDNHNTFEERLNALILGDFKLSKEILTKNEWLLMFINNEERVEIMEKLNIPMTVINRTVDCDHLKNLKKRKISIPVTLSSKYQTMELELNEILSTDNLDETLINYAYNHSLNTCINDENYLLRENLWLLKLVDSSIRYQIMEILNIQNNSKKKKSIITLVPNFDSNEFNLCHLSVSVDDYDKYHELNEQLFMLISKESFSLRELENFVHRSPLTLKIWPWLNDYELLSNMANVRKKI